MDSKLCAYCILPVQLFLHFDSLINLSSVSLPSSLCVDLFVQMVGFFVTVPIATSQMLTAVMSLVLPKISLTQSLAGFEKFSSSFQQYKVAMILTAVVDIESVNYNNLRALFALGLCTVVSCYI